MHTHHPHLSEPLLVHAFTFAVVLAAVVLGLLVLVEVFGPRLGALLVGLGA